MPEAFIVPEGIHRERIDKVLASAHPELSRAGWQRIIEEGLVLRAGAALPAKALVSAGDVLEYSIPAPKAAELKAVEIPLEVLFEDKHLVALNKASGMIVHPGAGTGEDTLVHALLAHCDGELSGIGGVERPGIVHRLDRETSGVILVAKSDAAHRGLAAQFSERSLHKEYLALVDGVPRLLSGTIDRPIGRHPRHRHKMAVVETPTGGRDAVTDWEVVEMFPQGVTLVRCVIHTGRTHQIRVHMKHLGHILLGDVVYGWKPNPALPVQPDRVMLHADHLQVRHPITGKSLDLRAPLPEDFASLLESLRGHKTMPARKAAVKRAAAKSPAAKKTRVVKPKAKTKVAAKKPARTPVAKKRAKPAARRKRG